MPNIDISVGRVGVCRQGALNLKIDRSTPLGNPYKLHARTSRNEVCDRYRDYLRTAWYFDKAVHTALKKILQALRRGHAVNLQCHCAPKRCHGDEIKAFIEEELWHLN